MLGKCLDDIGEFDEDDEDDFGMDMTFVVPPVKLPESMTGIRDLDDTEKSKILRFYETSFAHLYPFLHACVCLAKGEPMDSLFAMLEKLNQIHGCKENRQAITREDISIANITIFMRN